MFQLKAETPGSHQLPFLSSGFPGKRGQQGASLGTPISSLEAAASQGRSKPFGAHQLSLSSPSASHRRFLKPEVRRPVIVTRRISPRMNEVLGGLFGTQRYETQRHKRALYSNSRDKAVLPSAGKRLSILKNL